MTENHDTTVSGAAPDTATEDAGRARTKAYKKSLNLPRTSFPMRANLRQNEPATLKRWQRDKLFDQVVAAGDGDREYAFHDGPPYANGDIHTGHLINKVLKDIIVRSRNMVGRRCAYVPGWDCHGLPIEHKVLGEMMQSGKADKLAALDDATRRMAIRRACAAYAAKYKKLQSKQIERLLTFGDYENPYLTMTPDYEAAVLEVFAKLVEQGIVYRDLKPVHWSIANQTALAEAELEYRDREDPSIFVRFEVEDPAALASAFEVAEDRLGTEGVAVGPAFLIWTTTPWTLPANMLIAAHADFEYALVRFGARTVVVARDLLAKVTEIAGKEAEVLGTTKGSALVDLAYRHPFRPRSDYEHQPRIIDADFVTLEDGTGLVHVASGHGQEDFMVSQAVGVPVYSPVRGDGTYDDSVPEWLRGLSVWDANPQIVERLRESGHLFHDAPYPHSYPHDWRSKTPVIFRCTEQWFVAVDKPTRRDGRSLREIALEAADSRIEFVPSWGQNRMRGMLESRPDWCISRQRSWGLPIPAFRLPDGQVLLTPATVRAVASAVAKKGSDAWYTESPETLLEGWDPAADDQAPSGIDTGALELASLELGSLEKMFDIIDVWFESGASWNAVMRARGHQVPVDLYLEGSDQHRGWFQSSLLTAVGATGAPPMTTILTHGFGVDKNGRKMSKSEGNALNVDTLLADYGADVCRWWVSSLAYENDIKVDLSFFDTAGESYRKVRNTLRYLLSNLSDFEVADHAVDLASIPPASIDAYVLAEASKLRDTVLGAYDRFAIRQAHLALFDFCNETLSAFYLDAMKDRLYCDLADSPRRRRAQTAMYRIAELLTTLLAPLLPHTADEAWRALTGEADGSVHLVRVPKLEARANDRWPAVLETREQVSKALEHAKSAGIDNPLDAGIRLGDAHGTLAPFAADLVDIFGVSRVEVLPGTSEVHVEDLRDEPRCERSWRRDPSVRQRGDGGWLSDRDAAAVGVT